jgi:hypothetical protein
MQEIEAGHQLTITDRTSRDLKFCRSSSRGPLCSVANVQLSQRYRSATSPVGKPGSQGGRCVDAAMVCGPVVFLEKTSCEPAPFGRSGLFSGCTREHLQLLRDQKENDPHHIETA